MGGMDVLIKKLSMNKGDIKYSEMVSEKTGERWVLIDNHKTKKNRVMIRFDDLMSFIKLINKGE